MPENPFIDRYEILDSSALLDILDNRSEYQAQAVEAAEFELKSRKLTDEQLVEAKKEQTLRKEEKERKEQKEKYIGNKVNAWGTSIADTFNPFQKDIPSADKIIKLLSLFLWGLLFYQLYAEYPFLIFLFTDSSAKWEPIMILYYIPLLLLSTSGILFWLRKKLGWILATVYFAVETAGTVSSYIVTINREPSGLPGFDEIYPTPSPTAYLWPLLLYGSATWAICKQELREVYLIDKKTMFIALGIGLGLLLLISAIYL